MDQVKLFKWFFGKRSFKREALDRSLFYKRTTDRQASCRSYLTFFISLCLNNAFSLLDRVLGHLHFLCWTAYLVVFWHFEGTVIRLSNQDLFRWCCKNVVRGAHWTHYISSTFNWLPHVGSLTWNAGNGSGRKSIIIVVQTFAVISY